MNKGKKESLWQEVGRVNYDLVLALILLFLFIAVLSYILLSESKNPKEKLKS